MTQAERLQVAKLLSIIIRENDPEYQAELDESGERMERGQKAPETNPAAAHQRVLADGR